MLSTRISTGSEVLDALLEGGYETDAITTIYGPPGVGKTNLAILAALNVAKQGKKVIYVDTEGGFSIARLQQILPAYEDALNNIVFLKPTSFREQHQAVEKLKEIVDGKIGLIIIDTMTMLYRLQRSFKEDDNHNYDLSQQVRILNEIARKHNIPVLFTSQVYQAFDTGRVKIVGGDIMAYTSKCLLEIQAMHRGRRRIIVKKHRSIPVEKEASFQIVEKGIEKI